MIDRVRNLEKAIRDAGLTPVMVDIDRDDDRPWARFRTTTGYETLVGEGESDEEYAADIVAKARALHVLPN